jgi:hypothetical protein
MNNEKINVEKVYEDYLDALMKVLKDFDNISFILSNEKALELIERMETLGYKFNEYDTFSFKEFEELYNTDILLISKSYWDNKEHYSLESAYGYDNLKIIEGQDVVFIEEDLIDSDELKEYIDCPIVTLTEKEYSDEEDELDDLYEELTQDLIESLNENMEDEDFCPHCEIKDIVREAYEIGFQDGFYCEEE